MHKRYPSRKPKHSTMENITSSTVTVSQTTAPPTETMQFVVRLIKVCKAYNLGDNQVIALADASLNIAAGEFLAIMGPSGSGKSTLLHCAAGLDKPTSGQVEIDGQEISKLKDSNLTKLRAEKISFVFQAYNLIPVLTAERNILLPLKISSLKKAKPEVKSLFNELVKTLGIENCLPRLPLSISMS